MSKIFFDANILLDILLPSRANHAKAVKAYTTICDTYDILATSENILTTIEYIAVKNGTPCETIGKFFEGLEENFSLYGFGNILNESLELYRQACTNNQKVDFEDLLQLQCAVKNGCSTFITEDKGIHALDTKIEICSIKSIISI